VHWRSDERGRDIAVFVGSLRKESLNRKLAKALAELAPSSLKLEIVEIGQLPLYNQDFDEDPSPSMWNSGKGAGGRWRPFCHPEYNRSVPGALKNALDVASRPYGQSAWNGKPGAVISASPGAIGGFGGEPSFAAVAGVLERARDASSRRPISRRRQTL